MRLWINNTDLPERSIVRAILAGEQLLAERGVTLPACLDAFAAEARKEPPQAALQAFEDAEAQALAVAYGDRAAAGTAALVLVLGPGDLYSADRFTESTPC